MNKLSKIDNEITLNIEQLKRILDKIEFEEVCVFKIKKDIKEIPWNNIVYSGIYLIEIKNNNKHKTFDSWIDYFKKGWEDDKYLRKFVPNIKKKRTKKHESLNDWIPLYIGKSKNIGSRIKDHIYINIEKTTFALKLLARENLKNDVFRLSVIKLDVINYNIIVPFVEKHLRDRINPIIGKQ